MSLIWLDRDGRTHTPPAEWAGDMLAGHRDETWTWRLLDRTDRVVRELDGVTGGSLEINVNAETRGSGQLDWTGPVEDMPSWDQYRIQPIYQATFPDGSSVQWPMGVYLPSVPSVTHHDDGTVACHVGLLDKTIILRQAHIPHDGWHSPAANPVLMARNRITAAINPQGVPSSSRDRPVFPETTETLRTWMFWEVGTSVMQVVNDLLEAAGFYGLHADFDGTLRSSPYVPPAERPVVWAFRDGQAAIYDSGWTRNLDLAQTPNRVIAISRGDGQTKALRSVAEDNDPRSPFSYQARGRWIDRVEEGVEATSQKVLDDHARKVLRTAQFVAGTVELQHAPVPLAGHDRVLVTHSPTGVDGLDGTVQSMSITCTPGGLVRTTLRVVGW